MLATAGDVIFTGDAGGNFVAFDAANGKPLWHSRIGNIINAPQTYMVDGRQYVLVAVGDTLYAFSLSLTARANPRRAVPGPREHRDKSATESRRHGVTRCFPDRPR